MKISCVTASVLSARAVSLRVERERERVDSMGMQELALNGLMSPKASYCLQRAGVAGVP